MRESLIILWGAIITLFKGVHLPRTGRSRLKVFFTNLFTKRNCRYAIKTGIAVIISYLISMAFVPEYAFWAPISAIIVMQVNVSSSINSSLERIIGSLYGAIIGLAAHFVFPLDYISVNLGLFTISIFCALLLLLNTRYRLAGIAGITIFLVGPNATTEHIWAFSGVFLFHIIVSIIVALLVSLLLWPVSGAETLRQSLKRQYLLAADYLDSITLAFLDEQHHLPPSFLDVLHDIVSENRSTYREIKEYEAMNIARNYAELHDLLVGLEHISVHLASLLDALDSEADAIKEFPLKEELLSLSSSTSSGLRWIASHTDDQGLPEIRWSIEKFDVRLANLRNENILKNLNLPQLVQVFSFYNAMNHLSETVANLEEQIEIISHRKKRRNKVHRLRKLFHKIKTKSLDEKAIHDKYK